MPTFLLIRHGENDFTRKNKLPGQQAGIHLNERGQKQAAALAEFAQRLAHPGHLCQQPGAGHGDGRTPG